jgi:hypothetical protein
MYSLSRWRERAGDRVVILRRNFSFLDYTGMDFSSPGARNMLQPPYSFLILCRKGLQ